MRRKIGVKRRRKRVNATIAHRMFGPDGAASHGGIGQRLLMFLMRHLGEYLEKNNTYAKFCDVFDLYFGQD